MDAPMTEPPARRATDTPESALPWGQQVFQNAHFTVLVDERVRIIATVRNTTPYDSLAELRESIDTLSKALDRLGRERYALLVDVRAVPGRNDSEFDVALQRLLPLWLLGFRRVGVVLRSTAGLLQIQRHAKQDGIERWPTLDAAAVVKYLSQE